MPIHFSVFFLNATITMNPPCIPSPNLISPFLDPPRYFVGSFFYGTYVVFHDFVLSLLATSICSSVFHSVVPSSEWLLNKYVELKEIKENFFFLELMNFI